MSAESVIGMISANGLPSAIIETAPCIMKDATLSGLSVASVCGIGEKPSPSISWSSIPVSMIVRAFTFASRRLTSSISVRFATPSRYITAILILLSHPAGRNSTTRSSE